MQLRRQLISSGDKEELRDSFDNMDEPRLGE
jgi:hypothetical protein